MSSGLLLSLFFTHGIAHLDFIDQAENDCDAEHGVSMLQTGLNLRTPSCSSSFPPGRHLVKIEVQPSLIRQFLLFVPEQLQKATGRTPLVVHWHGCTDTPYYQDELAGLSKEAGRRGWLAILPFGPTGMTLDKKWIEEDHVNLTELNRTGTIVDVERSLKNSLGPNACCLANCTGECCTKGLNLTKDPEQACGCSFVDDPRDEFSDMLLFEKILDWSSRNLCADLENVFVSGFSSGAKMTDRIACDRADLVKAVASIEAPRPSVACHPSRPVTWISTCGTEDSNVQCMEDFEARIQKWRIQNSCHGAAMSTVDTAQNKCYSVFECLSNSSVHWCLGLGFHHEWSGHRRPDGSSLGSPELGIDYTRYIFDLFEKSMR